MSGFNTNLEVLLNQILQVLNGPDQVETLVTGGVSATTTNYSFTPKSNYIQGNIVAVTDSTFNGTTTTLSLKGSNDGVTFVQVYADDDITALTYTLSTNSTYAFLLKRILFKHYKLIYTTGDATLGTYSATVFTKHNA